MCVCLFSPCEFKYLQSKMLLLVCDFLWWQYKLCNTLHFM